MSAPHGEEGGSEPQGDHHPEGQETRQSAREAELRLALEKAQLLVEVLEATNVALTRANRELERSIAQRRAELESASADLRKSEEHLRLIFESATEYAIFTLDTEGRVTSWNPGARRILGYEAEEILGRSGEIIFLPEDRAARAAEIELCTALEEGRAADDRWHLRKDGSRFWASGQVMPLRDASGTLHGFLKILRDQTDRRRVEERGALLLRELDHRVKNTLAVVQAVAAQTLRQAGISPELRSTFDARLMALARSQDMLAQSGWEGALLSEAVERTLEPYAVRNAGRGGATPRILTSGPPVRLASSTVVTLNLGLHELATNAAKYGALSVPTGRVEVTWRLERAAQPRALPVLEILWRERGGPPVQPPERRGFGSRLLERGLAREASGEVALQFLPEGVECRIRLPLPPPVTAP